ncbi:MAG: right-handed parallel beta-helix repeat-containing protein [Pyrinomonadaceae bacterium]
MNDLPRQKLCEIVRRHGRSVIERPRRCEGLLRDYCGPYRREVSVLVMALEEHVAADLLAVHAGMPRAVLFAKLISRLSDNLALSENAARWAVNSWALALGVVAREQLVEDEEAAVKTEQAAQIVATAKSAATPAKSAIPAKSATAATPAARNATTGTASVSKPNSSLARIVVSAAGNGDYSTINEALRKATPGARLLVRPGVYDESIVLKQPVEIVGEGRREEIVLTSAAASCIQMLTAQATVRGLTLRGRAGKGGEKFFAVDIPQGKLLLEDCDISSTGLSCVGIRNPMADPLLRRCAIHDGADSGLYIFELAAGTIEDCDIYGNANVNVAITGHARPVIKACKIHDGGDAGIVVWGGGAGVIEECEIYANRSAGIGISDGGEPTVKRCQIYHGENSGVFVHRGGRGFLEDCNIYGNREANVAITLGGDLQARGCRIHNGQSSGVLLSEDGRGRFDECDINGNADAGIAVHEGCVAVVHGCNVNRNETVGVRVKAGSAASVEGCNLTGNLSAPWETEYGAHVESRRNIQ